MKEKVNVLFVCGYGVGSSAMAESIVKKSLKDLNVPADVQHTSVGEMKSFQDWKDIIVITTKMAEGVEFKDDEHVIIVKNIMDGKGIAKQVLEIVEESFAEVLA